MKQGTNPILIILAFLTFLLAGAANAQTIPVEWGQYSDLDLDVVIGDFIGNLDPGMDAIDLAVTYGEEYLECSDGCYGLDNNPPLPEEWLYLNQCINQCVQRLFISLRTLGIYGSGQVLGLQCLDVDGDGQCDGGSSGVRIGFLPDNKSGNETEVRAWSTVKSMYR